MESGVVSLPEDLWTEILVRLPVKSLMRFKCVQRSWNALLGSCYFATWYSYWHRSGSDERLMIFYQDREEEYDERLMEFYSKFRITLLCDDPSQPPEEVECPFFDKSSLLSWRSYGPCNGAFCLYGLYTGFRHQVILWNPATREVKVVPPPPHKPSHDHYLRYTCGNDTRFVLRGFGVDPNTNDVKVVNVLFDCTNPVTSAEVYNLSTNSWTVIHDDPVLATIVRPRASKYNAFANGVYHWLTGDDDAVGDRRDILCFDFRSDQFRKLKAPIAICGSCVSDHIAEVNDSIAYVVQYCDPIRLQIWILNQDTWTKIYNFEGFGPSNLSFFFIWKDGAEILGGKHPYPLVSDARLVSYSSDGQPVRQFQFNLPITPFYIRKYVESIAPLSI